MWYPRSLSETETFAKVCAIVVGGLAAYWKFFKGKTFHPRLEPSVTAKQLVDESGRIYLAVVCKAKNVGLSRININHRASSLRLVCPEASLTADIAEIRWASKALLAVDVFQSHKWIEGAESIDDEHLFVLPDHLSLAYKVELRVTRQKRFRWIPRANSWAQHTIVEGIARTPKLQPKTEGNSDGQIQKAV
jgi:hypothetical protein